MLYCLHSFSSLPSNNDPKYNAIASWALNDKSLEEKYRLTATPDFISLPACSDSRVLTLNDVYGLKCKTRFCKTVGLVLVRVTVVDYFGNVVCDAFIKPANRTAYKYE